MLFSVFQHGTAKIFFKYYAEIPAGFYSQLPPLFHKPFYLWNKQALLPFHSGLNQIIVEIDSILFLKNTGQIAMVHMKIFGNLRQA